MTSRGATDSSTPTKRSVRSVDHLQRTGSGQPPLPLERKRLQGSLLDAGKGKRRWITLVALFLAVTYCLVNVALFMRHYAVSQGKVTVHVKRRLDRGSKSWSKHLREIMNHTGAWDYGAIWDPLLELEKKTSMTGFHAGSSAGGGPDESICQRPLAMHLLRRASPPELEVKNLGSKVMASRPKVKIAFVLFAYNVETLLGAERVLHWMYHSDHTFVFHVDSNSPLVFMCYLKQKYSKIRNVYFGPRERSAWGSYGIVQAEISALRLAMVADKDWDVAMPVSGGSLPIKPREQIDCHIKSWQNHVIDRIWQQRGSGTDPRSVSIIPTQDTHAVHPNNPQRNANQLRTNATCTEDECDNTPNNLPWYKGSQWHIIGRNLVNFTLTDPSAQAWLDFFGSPKFTLAADESWVNTIAKYSPFQESTVFSRKAGAMLALWNGNDCVSHRNPRPKTSPCYIGMHDWRDLETSNKIFARKFLFNDPVIPRIWEELVGNSRHGTVATC